MQTVKIKTHNSACISSKLYNNFIGFDENYEFLPDTFDKFNTKERLRQLFLYMSNIILPNISQFSKYEQQYLKNYTLSKAFEYKIAKELNRNIFTQNRFTKFNFCKNSTIIINAYLKKENINYFLSVKQCRVKVANFISTSFRNNTLQLFFDKHLLFHEFVLRKVKKMHKDKKVIDLGNAVCIKSNKFHGIKIYTSWKNIIVNEPDIDDELQDAIKSIKKGEFYQIFLAYPKNDTFKRHIPIYVDELKNKEYQIKAVPYSLRSIIEN